MKNDQRILIIRLSSIGDVLLTSPFIRQTRIRFPDAQIDFVIKKQFIGLIADNPHLNQIYTVDPQKGIGALIKLRRQLQKKKYDFIFDLHNNLRSRVLTCCLKESQIGHMHKDLRKRFLLVKFKKNTYEAITPIAQRYLQVGQAAKIKDDQNGLEIFWKDSVEEQAADILAGREVRAPYFALAPGATYQTKRWPQEYYKELIHLILQNYKEQIVLLGSPAERESFSELIVSERVINLAGELSLQQAAVVLGRATVLVSNDSGLMHMATAVKTPVLAIFGSTVKELGFFPYRSKYFVLENKALQCRPCSHVGRNSCPERHFKCMKDLKPQAAFRLLRRLIS